MFDVNQIRKDFPMLNGKKMQGHPLIYLDNGATTLKPQVVIESVCDYLTIILETHIVEIMIYPMKLMSIMNRAERLFDNLSMQKEKKKLFLLQDQQTLLIWLHMVMD